MKLFTPKQIGILTFLVLLNLTLFTIHINKQKQIITQHAAGNIYYPANVEYGGNDLAYGQYNPNSLTNPNIQGVDVIMNWANVELQQGTFNWTPADNQMAAWAAAGKKFNLIIRYIHELRQPNCSSSPQWLPAWEAARVPTFCSGGGEVVPDFFDVTFKSDLKAYVDAIAQHMTTSQYKNSLNYVRIGVGFAGEAYPCVNCTPQDLQQLTTWGYSITTWVAWQKEMLSAYKNSFTAVTSAPIIYSLGDNDIDPVTNQPVSQEVGYWAASQGMGVGQQGLNNSPGMANGQTVQMMKYVRSHYPSAYIQFQTVRQVTGNYNSPATEIQGDVAIADSAGAFTIEWYDQDTNNPSYQQYFQQWQQTINNKYGTPTPSQNGTLTVTPSPTPVISYQPTIVLTPTISLSPKPTITPGEPVIDLEKILLHGLGTGGDNANPNSVGNINPFHVDRNVALLLENIAGGTGQQVFTGNGTIHYVYYASPNITEGRLYGNIGIAAPNGFYVLKIKPEGYLEKPAPGLINIGAPNQVNPGLYQVITPIAFTAGDIDNDNKLDILDYNILVSCFGSKYTTSSCLGPATAQGPGADIDDDGKVDGIDINLFLREMSVQNGQ